MLNRNNTRLHQSPLSQDTASIEGNPVTNVTLLGRCVGIVRLYEQRPSTILAQALAGEKTCAENLNRQDSWTDRIQAIWILSEAPAQRRSVYVQL